MDGEKTKMADLACAIPYRLTENGPELLLVTSRKKRDWIFPKGNVDGADTPRVTAEKEAWEEAGVSGILSEKRVGQYVRPRGGERKIIAVYLMQVDKTEKDWPEKSIRNRKWVPLERAAKYLEREPLLNLLPKVADVLTREAVAA